MRQKVLMGILAALLLMVAWVYLVPGDEAAPPPAMGRVPGRIDGDSGLVVPVRATPADGGTAAAAAGGGSSGRGAKDAQTVLALRLDALSRVPRSFFTGRDPWRFVEPPPPPPPVPKRPSAAELRAMQEAEAARQRLLAEQQRIAAEEAAIPKPPPFTWIYIGNFGPARQRIAVFTDGKRVWNAREGDILEDKFVVAQIGYESVDIRFVGFPNWPPERLAVKH
jgi:hypothetical protein